MRPALRLMRRLAVGKLARLRAERLKAALQEQGPSDDETTEFLRQVSLAGIAKRAAAAGTELTPPERTELPKTLLQLGQASSIAAFSKA